MHKEDTLTGVLANRKAQYGDSGEVSKLSISLLEVAQEHPLYKKHMTHAMKMAFHMICNKVARQVCGGASKADTWVDIQGYLQIVIDDINGYGETKLKTKPDDPQADYLRKMQADFTVDIDPHADRVAKNREASGMSTYPARMEALVADAMIENNLRPGFLTHELGEALIEEIMTRGQGWSRIYDDTGDTLVAYRSPSGKVYAIDEEEYTGGVPETFINGSLNKYLEQVAKHRDKALCDVEADALSVQQRPGMPPLKPKAIHNLNGVYFFDVLTHDKLSKEDYDFLNPHDDYTKRDYGLTDERPEPYSSPTDPTCQLWDWEQSERERVSMEKHIATVRPDLKPIRKQELGSEGVIIGYTDEHGHKYSPEGVKYNLSPDANKYKTKKIDPAMDAAIDAGVDQTHRVKWHDDGTEDLTQYATMTPKEIVAIRSNIISCSPSTRHDSKVKIPPFHGHTGMRTGHITIDGKNYSVDFWFGITAAQYRTLNPQVPMPKTGTVLINDEGVPYVAS